MSLSIGIIGVGNIAYSIIEGMCSKENKDIKIVLSPRNKEKAEELADRYSNIEIASSNQEVVDNSNWIIISLIPKYAEDIISKIKFKKNQCVISVMTDIRLSKIKDWIGNTRILLRMVPLPFISKRIGPIVFYPGNNEIEQFFSPLGEIIIADDENILEVFLAITSIMSSYYMLVYEVAKWGEIEGIQREQSIDYTISFFEALLHMSKNENKKDIEKLANEMTPGGLNELALTFIRERDGLTAWTNALNKVLNRINYNNRLNN